MLIAGILIAGFLHLLPVTLEGCRCALWVICVYVECEMGDMTIEGPADLDILNIGGWCEVLEGVRGDVVLVGKDAP